MRPRKTPFLLGAALALMADSLPAALVPVVSPPQWAEMHQMTDLVTWNLKPRSVLPVNGNAHLRLPCGTYGVFDLFVEEGVPAPGPVVVPGSGGFQLLSASPLCADLACGSENPPLYPSGLSSLGLVDAVDGVGVGEIVPALPEGTSPWIPCADGSCFAAVGLEEYVPSKPWVAVLDWHDLHGWSVGWTIVGIAGPAEHEAVLLPLDDVRLIPFSRTGSTDVHVLTQLCSILEAVDIRGIPRPAVINMSFGRRLRDDDAVSTSCNPAHLSCQVARVLGRLVATSGPAAEAGTVAVASAGNDRKPLFPAGLVSVLPAGSLQLGLYKESGQTKPSWETPSYAPRAEALMPGYGLCIGERIGVDSANEWAAPAGTSYAAAVLSGWLSGVLATMPVYAPLDTRPWFPNRVCDASRTSCTHVLTHGTTPYGTNPRIDALLRQMFQPRRPCGRPSQVAASEVLNLATVTASEGELPEDTFLDVFADLKLPAPPSTPCIPCRGLTSVDGGSSAFSGAKARPAVLSVDLSGISALTPPFPPALASQINVDGLFLRVGETFLRLVPATGNQSSSFSVLETGAVRRLAISGVTEALRGGIQPSLIFVLRPIQPDLLERPFWISIPILVDK